MPALSPSTAVPPRPHAVPAAAVSLTADRFKTSGTIRPFTLSIHVLDARIAKETGTATTDGNAMTLFIDGPAAYPEMHRLIASAQKTIHLETFIFRTDEAAWDIANALIERAKHGVKVRVSTELMGALDTPIRSDIYAVMRDAGIEVRHPLAATLDGLTAVDHRKMLIVDGATAMTGGMNIGNEYRGTGPTDYHDLMVRVEGPVVHDMQRQFLATWKETGARGFALDEAVLAPLPKTPAGTSRMRVITTGPSNDIQRALFAAIESARHTINIEAAYFTDDGLVNRLEAAAKRGVKVNLILPADCDNPVAGAAANFHLARLAKAGVKVHFYDDRWMHIKAATVDGAWGMVGSCNFDTRALVLNRELNVAFSDRESVAKLDRDLFAKDLTTSVHVAKPTLTASQQLAAWATRLVKDLI